MSRSPFARPQYMLVICPHCGHLYYWPSPCDCCLNVRYFGGVLPLPERAPGQKRKPGEMPVVSSGKCTCGELKPHELSCRLPRQEVKVHCPLRP